MRYKAGSIASTMLVFSLILGVVAKAFPFGFSTTQRDTMNLQTFTVSDFGDSKDHTNGLVWAIRYSRFARPVVGDDYRLPPDPEYCNATYLEAKPLGLPMEVDSQQKWSLGIKAAYIKQSYNWIEIIPFMSSNFQRSASGTQPRPILLTNNEFTSVGPVGNDYPKPITLIGVVKSLDVWVWGGNYKYWLEFYLEDYKGYLHRLTAGDINYVGWRNLRTKVPESIPQAEQYVPFMKPLKLTMLKIWAYPTERIDQFFIYFDFMQVQTDVYVERFNGDDLAWETW